jgi:hypothetical protein
VVVSAEAERARGEAATLYAELAAVRAELAREKITAGEAAVAAAAAQREVRFVYRARV